MNTPLVRVQGSSPSGQSLLASVHSLVAAASSHEWTAKLIDVGNTVFKKRHPEVGARPGTLLFAEDAPPTRVRMISYDAQQVDEREIKDGAQLREALAPHNVTWVDIQGFGDEAFIREIGKTFSLHPLVLEDIVNMPQRPKAEAYEGQILVITRMVHVRESSEIDMEQVSVVLAGNYVLTFQERYGDVFDPVRNRIRAGKGNLIRRSGADYLGYAIVDTIVDGYYPVIEALGDHLEQLENLVIDNPSDDVLRVLNGTKNMLVNLRRGIWPQREAVNRLIRDENPLITEEVRMFFRDTYDHCVQTAEVIEMYREMAAGLMNTYLSSIANRTNEVMKVLTIMASVFIPLTFVAGIYGMNFEHMPELHIWWAYPLVWATMLGLVATMLCYFWSKGWIGRGKQ